MKSSVFRRHDTAILQNKHSHWHSVTQVTCACEHTAMHRLSGCRGSPSRACSGVHAGAAAARASTAAVSPGAMASCAQPWNVSGARLLPVANDDRDSQLWLGQTSLCG